METKYNASLITGANDHQHLAKGFEIGKRFHSAPVIRLADAKPMELAHTVKADGRWRLFLFAGSDDRGQKDGAVAQLCTFLEEDQNSPILRHTPEGANPDSVIDVRAVFQQNHRDLALDEMPSFLLPSMGNLNLTDYEKIFCSDLKSGSDIFDMHGIDRKSGAIVVVRPDQYVADIFPIWDVEKLKTFLTSFMLKLG